MWRPSTRSSEAALLALVAVSWPSRAYGQACCAGGSAITPGRLELHEDALVGAELRAASVIGSYQFDAYRASPPGTPEYDYEEDVFGAVRFLRRGQVALLVPFDETYRHTPTDGGHFGGGVGDVNLSGRYDLVLQGDWRYVPGVALLAGVTFPTGKPPESATQPLAVDATGIGAFQVNAALALEQTFGSWLANATAIVAKRTEHGGETLGTQITLLAAGAYTWAGGVSAALSASYTFEGDGTISGADVPGSAKSVTVVTASGLWPVADTFRLLGGVFVDPPVGALGSNQPTQIGVTLTGIRSWM
jgi:hypothetical protein